MKKETYNELKKHIQSRKEKGYSGYSKAIDFIDYLVSNGVPLSAITTSDFSTSVPAIYITREYGRTNGGPSKARRYERWSKSDMNNALIFYMRD